ncbi:MAG: tripartite tricarboxylate transporter TctB family protein [Azoarcus sp.]|nr:tripartite tricarboxylate transporter TctB family protein [Azoarcus sp.]
MEQDKAPPGEDKALVSVRTMEVAFGLLIVAVGIVVVWDSIKVGAGWEPGLGPGSGYFPFYIGLLIIGSGAASTIAALLPGAKAYGDAPFVTRSKFKAVLQVFIPTAIYVLLMNYIGLYAAAALYVAGFMIVNGKYPVVKTLPYVIILPVLLFVLFERWFLISLPKGPIEAMLGL